MAKRLTDSRKWQDDWFIELDKDHKLFWIYLLDTCDHVGIYKPALGLANFCLKTSFSEDDIFKVFNDRIIKLDDGHWFIPKFIRFQYGSLSKKSTFHLKIISELKTRVSVKHLKFLNRVSTGCQQGVDTLKDKREIRVKVKRKSFLPPTLEEVSSYCQERKNGVDPKKWMAHYEAKGWLIGKTPMANWKAAVHTWEKNDTEPKSRYKELPPGPKL